VPISVKEFQFILKLKKAEELSWY